MAARPHRSLMIRLLLLTVGWLSVGLGVLGGWLAAGAVLRMLDMPPPVLTIDPWLTLGTGLVVVAAGALASVLPGLRAALASPVEAMADVG